MVRDRLRQDGDHLGIEQIVSRVDVLLFHAGGVGLRYKDVPLFGEDIESLFLGHALYGVGNVTNGEACNVASISASLAACVSCSFMIAAVAACALVSTR